MLSLIGAKKSQSQKFLENGMRIPVTLIDVKDNCVVAVKTNDRDHYQAIQLGYGAKKNANKALVGQAKGAKLEKTPKFLREVRILDGSETLPEIGTILNPSEVFQPGDIVNVTGTSKGKGFAGVVKRHGFHGGPKTHGQSDRHRAPGSIGQGTTPGRVYKGKRMAGRMGSDNVTVRNLKIIEVTDDGVLIIKGLVPGIINSLIVVNKVGTDKKFVPLWKEVVGEELATEVPVEEASAQEESAGSSSVSDDAQTVTEETLSSDSSSLSESQSTSISENSEQEVGSTLDSSENGQAPVTQSSDEKPTEEVKEGEKDAK